MFRMSTLGRKIREYVVAECGFLASLALSVYFGQLNDS